jgi:hypothetical protein
MNTFWAQYLSKTISAQIAHDRKNGLQKRMCKEYLEELSHSALDGQLGGAANDVSKLFFFFVVVAKAE